VYLVVLASLALLPGLGSSGRLTYHEAFVAQGAREILTSGKWSYPTIGSLPWLEKPPLSWWLVAILGHCVGVVDETVARLPSVIAAIGLVVGVAILAGRHYGAGIGLLAGAIQATTAWTVMRGRLAEADVLLACLIVWAIVAFDRLLTMEASEARTAISILKPQWYYWRCAFLVLLGISALVKGIGFGVVLISAVAVGILAWERDAVALHRLWAPRLWALAALLALTWPMLIVAQHGHAALSLWKMHIWARLIPQEGGGPFAGESLGEYVAALLAQALPWTPFAFVGAWQSLGRALGRRHSSRESCAPISSATMVTGDRLLWVWAVLPLTLLALVPVKNAHYAISAQVPWSIWAALALARCATLLCIGGWEQQVLLRAAQLGFLGIGLTYGLGLWIFGPWLGRRGTEWAFYEAAGQKVPAGMHLALFYDDWDRNPYLTPFGSVPHDLAVRLFYLGRSVCWHMGPTVGWPMAHDLGSCAADLFGLSAACSAPTTLARDFAVIGRDRDLPVLEQLGHVEVVLQGPNVRYDRRYVLFQITPNSKHSHFARGSSMEARNVQVAE
jgi:4-amino-4-deoxy-L-arabinose transferase-like glycosyltransferase